ncbi:hypothetical protein OKA05_21520 [Luteolibacter arcticus]|uniref:Uncharacterized protein n=1 Tax=Luteolibacter arcticus TaxID=1581411 RepID=A0ABT3GNR1_9BACT|nr:hypothetical protein [Luteolibacter arcticus]MCW1925154.1 hypothetical protein [Luteolibacter arcticus]
MNAIDQPPKHCSQPSECEPGDWVEPQDVPDWPEDAEIHAYVLPGQVMVQPMQQLPATVPLMSWTFHRERVPGDSGSEVTVWVRQA